ncbi:unnamed protein product [Bathycoccus prasinos]
MGMREEEAFRKMEKIPWEKRADTAFFLGTLSDCSVAKEKHSGDMNFCARAKIVYEAAHSNLSVLQDIGTVSSFRDNGLNVDCPRCQKDRLTSQEFVKKLYSHKYLLNMPGVGQSRRMSQLLRSGGVIFQAENKGYQFYDFDLKPGSHYITFDPQLGVPGAGNLVSRINFAKDNNFALQNIAARAKSYSKYCLTESSIDVFVTSILESYSRLLVGNPLNFPIVDLSSCISKTERCAGISWTKLTEQFGLFFAARSYIDSDHSTSPNSKGTAILSLSPARTHMVDMTTYWDTTSHQIWCYSSWNTFIFIRVRMQANDDNENEDGAAEGLVDLGEANPYQGAII